MAWGRNAPQFLRRCKMSRDQILQEIKSLAMSQGSYGRLYHQLMVMKDQEEDAYEECMTTLENQNFKDALDMVYYFEC
jgi:hypothetical protein